MEKNEQNKTEEIIEFADGQVYFWLEQDSSVMLKAVSKGGKSPVELESFEARQMGEKLIKMADKIDADLL